MVSSGFHSIPHQESHFIQDVHTSFTANASASESASEPGRTLCAGQGGVSPEAVREASPDAMESQDPQAGFEVEAVLEAGFVGDGAMPSDVGHALDRVTE